MNRYPNREVNRKLTQDQIDSGDLFVWYATTRPDCVLELRFRKWDGAIISALFYMDCDECQGSGYRDQPSDIGGVMIERECPDCNGTGTCQVEWDEA